MRLAWRTDCSTPRFRPAPRAAVKAARFAGVAKPSSVVLSCSRHLCILLPDLRIEQCAALLRDPSALPALAPEDRIFLTRAYERLRGSLASLPRSPIPNPR
jgi:hypothetical protein